MFLHRESIGYERVITGSTVPESKREHSYKENTGKKPVTTKCHSYNGQRRSSDVWTKTVFCPPKSSVYPDQGYCKTTCYLVRFVLGNTEHFGPIIPSTGDLSRNPGFYVYNYTTTSDLGSKSLTKIEVIEDNKRHFFFR